jgi:hypothetical protein
VAGGRLNASLGKTGYPVIRLMTLRETSPSSLISWVLRPRCLRRVQGGSTGSIT